MTPTTIRQAMNELQRYLTLHGFERKGRIWNRNRSQYVDVVEAQRSSSEPLLTLNFGVCLNEASTLMWPESNATGPREPADCAIRRRIVDSGGKRDLWFDSRDPGWNDHAVRVVREQVVPYLDSVIDSKSFLLGLAGNSPQLPQDAGYRAYVLAWSGDQSRACMELSDAIATLHSPLWKKRLQEFALRLGCVT